MALRLIICLLGCMQWKFTFSMTALITGEISENITFLHKTFPVQPSIQAIIEVDVYDPNLSLTDQGHYPIVGIYTTHDHVNIKKQCTDIRYVQLGNYNRHPGITMDPGESRPLNCHVDNTTNMLQCTGNITIQDFIPRHFSFALGFRCENNGASDSLKGLIYYFGINATNDTQCSEIDVANTCYHYMKYGVDVPLQSEYSTM